MWLLLNWVMFVLLELWSLDIVHCVYLTDCAYGNAVGFSDGLFLFFTLDIAHLSIEAGGMNVLLLCC